MCFSIKYAPFLPVGLGMTSVRLASCYIRASAVFREPILSWTAEVPSRFFRAMYSSLNERLSIHPNDFVAPGGASLGDCSAALRIFGGNSTLTLKANEMIAEFPSLTPDGIELANSVIFQGYEALRAEFNELEIGSIRSNAGNHLEITGDTQVGSILCVSAPTALQQRSKNIRGAIFESALRFRLVGEDGKWNVKVTAERSELVNNGIFVLREVVVSDLTVCETTQQQFDLIESIDRMILEVLDLNFDSPSSDDD